MRGHAPRWMHWVVGLVSAWVLVAPAWAVEDIPFQEPGINYAEAGGLYIQWLAGVLFIAAVVLIAIKNPHRSHMD